MTELGDRREYQLNRENGGDRSSLTAKRAVFNGKGGKGRGKGCAAIGNGRGWYPSVGEFATQKRHPK